MAEFYNMNAGHEHLIMCIAIDFYKERIATCSIDKHIKIWDLDNGQILWNLTSSWKAHDGPIWKVDWARPEFGQMLASCSYDHTVSIWEQISSYTEENGTIKYIWDRKGHLTDSRVSVIDVKFSPKSVVIVLASFSIDGHLRIYEFKKPHWILQHSLLLKIRGSCIIWNPTLTITPMIVIGAVGKNKHDIKSSKLFICYYNAMSLKWTKTKSISSFVHPIYDMNFASNIGRSYCILGVATNNIRILKLIPNGNASKNFSYKVETVAQLNDHLCPVRSVAWKISGTDFGSSDENGYIRLWTEVSTCTWRCIQVLNRNIHLPISQLNIERRLTAELLKYGKQFYPSQILWYT